MNTTEWWNEPEMFEDERVLERREHQLRAMNHGHVIKIMPGSKEEMRAQLDRLIEFELEDHDDRIEFFNQFRDDNSSPRPPSLCLLTEADIDHLLEHGYIQGVDIVLSTEFLINDDSILLRDSLMREVIGYADEWDTSDKSLD
ncbi:MAG: hypothetical protein OXC79_04920 [Candidatus Poribacteria bacterium]|nr:hypothetical protein [Candidatus Poribacteria bacterium]